MHRHTPGMGRVPRPLKLAYICFKRNVLILHNSPLLNALAPGYIPRAEEIHRQRRSANRAEIKHLERLDSIVAIAIISMVMLTPHPNEKPLIHSR